MRTLDVPATAQRLTEFVKATVAGAGFSRVVANVSGGVDSATAVALAAAALGPEQVYALLLPYQEWHDAASGRARRLLEGLRVPPDHVRQVDIAPMVSAFAQALGLEHGAAADQVRLGNVMARVRMVVLFDHAKRLGALALGTENKSEHYLGYFTRFGDEASDLEPLRSLYKTEVYALARHLGVPQDIVGAAPSADLWPGQTDEGQFGFTYAEADQVLYGLCDLRLSVEELARRGLDRAVIAGVKAWAEQVEFKHHLPHVAPEPVVAGA